MSVQNVLVPIQVLVSESLTDGEMLFLRGKSSSCKVFNNSLTKTLYYKSGLDDTVTCSGSSDADGFVGPGHIDFVQFTGKYVFLKWVAEPAEQVFVQEVW